MGVVGSGWEGRGRMGALFSFVCLLGTLGSRVGRHSQAQTNSTVEVWGSDVV